jgi:hypothetical protein
MRIAFAGDDLPHSGPAGEAGSNVPDVPWKRMEHLQAMVTGCLKIPFIEF